MEVLYLEIGVVWYPDIKKKKICQRLNRKGGGIVALLLFFFFLLDVFMNNYLIEPGVLSVRI